VIVGGMQPYIDYTLMGAKGIASLNDLRGKVVGVTGAGGIAEFASVEGLAKKGFVRDRDYKIIYGVGNSPARAQALEAGRIQASPFSFMEKIELERKGFPTLFDIGEVVSNFRSSRSSRRARKPRATRKCVALLRGLKRGIDVLKSEPEKVIAMVLKKKTYGDAATVRKVVEQFRRRLFGRRSRVRRIEGAITARDIEADAKSSAPPISFSSERFRRSAGKAIAMTDASLRTSEFFHCEHNRFLI
jgi:ABC-type nitrate/sulfonate/bicarbonate transport system substrate-binding protein